MFEIKITINDNGQCSVEGPIQDKLRCFGALELAKEAIHLYFLEHEKKKKEQEITIPGAQDLVAQIQRSKELRLPR